jgi:hypothetical protein
MVMVSPEETGETSLQQIESNPVSRTRHAASVLANKKRGKQKYAMDTCPLLYYSAFASYVTIHNVMQLFGFRHLWSQILKTNYYMKQDRTLPYNV